MKSFKTESYKLLNKSQLKRIFGGNELIDHLNDSTCTADCGDGTSVSCTGASCTAKDYVGCTNDEHEKICPIA